MAGNPIRTLVVKWVGDTKGLDKATSQVQSGFKGIVDKAKGMQGPIGGTFAKAVGGAENLGASFGVIAGAAAGATGFLVGATKAALEDQHSQEQLAGQLERSTGATKDQIEQTEKWITKTQNQTGVIDDQLRPALAKLVTSTGDVKKAQDLLNIALDVSAATGRPLEAVTTALAKASAGQFTALRKLIPTLDVTRAKQEGMTYVQQKLNDTFGGAAAKAADTTEGKLKILSVRYQDLKEEIGKNFVPTVDGAASALELVGKASDATDGALNTFLFSGSIQGVVTNFKRLFGGAKESSSAAEEGAKRLAKATKTYQDLVATGTATDKELSAAKKKVTDEAEKQGMVTSAVNAALRDGADAASDNADATQEQADAAKAQAEANKRADDAIRGVVDAMTGSRNAALNLRTSQLNLNGSISEYNAKAKEARDHGFKNADANKAWETAAINVQQDILNVASAADQAAQKEAALHNKTYDARDSANAQKEALIKLRDNIDPRSPFRQYLDGLISDLDRMSGTRTGKLSYTVTVNGKPITYEGLNALTAITEKTTGELFSRQAGGPVSAGTPYLVGEQGPEVIVPRSAGTVIPNAALGAGGNGASGRVNNYYMTINAGLGADPAKLGRAVVDAIRAYEARNGKAWRAN